MSFETLNLLPYGPMLAKTKKYLAKIQNFKFHKSLSNFGRDPPRSVHDIFGSVSGAYFQRRCRLDFFVPYVNENEKKIVKIKN